MDAIISCLAPLQLPAAAPLMQVQTSSSLFATTTTMLSSDSSSAAASSSMHSASSPTISSHHSPLLLAADHHQQQQLMTTAMTTSSSSYAPPHAIPAASVRRPSPRRGQLAAGRAGKRRSRASKRAPTTFITTDPTNFRIMVQHVTGAEAPIDLQEAIMLRSTSDDGAYYSSSYVGGSGVFVGNPLGVPPPGGANDGDPAAALHQQQQPCFPTLDSWNVTTMYDDIV